MWLTITGIILALYHISMAGCHYFLTCAATGKTVFFRYKGMNRVGLHPHHAKWLILADLMGCLLTLTYLAFVLNVLA